MMFVKGAEAAWEKNIHRVIVCWMSKFDKI